MCAAAALLLLLYGRLAPGSFIDILLQQRLHWQCQQTHLGAKACVGGLVARVDAQPKVCQLDGALSCEQHILELDVPAATPD